MKVAEQIRLAIEDGIRSGTLRPGEPINEAELISRHKVSRTPVREALLQLQAQGLLVIQPRGGMVVAKMSLQQLLALWELLAELEGFAARLACERMTPNERTTLDEVHRAAEASVEAEDHEQWKKCNLAFHEVLYCGSRNPFLREEILRIRALTGVYRQHAFSASGHVSASWRQHGDMVAAILRRDRAAAFEAMVAHLSPGTGAQGFASFVATLPKELLD